MLVSLPMWSKSYWKWKCFVPKMNRFISEKATNYLFLKRNISEWNTEIISKGSLSATNNISLAQRFNIPDVLVDSLSYNSQQCNSPLFIGELGVQNSHFGNGSEIPTSILLVIGPKDSGLKFYRIFIFRQKRCRITISCQIVQKMTRSSYRHKTCSGTVKV